MSNLLQKASIITTPTAYDTGKILSVKPVQYFGSELILSTMVNTSYSTFDEVSSSGFHAINSSGTSQRAGTVDEIIFVTGKIYQVNIDVSVISGNAPFFRARQAIATSPVLFSGQLTDGNNLITFTSNNTFTGVLEFSNGSSTEYRVSNVSIKEVLNADFDFTRNSSATRVGSNGLIQDVASNLPRIDYTGGVGSWKFEPQRTNSVSYSEDFSQSFWSLQGTGSLITANTTTAPNGLQSASTLTLAGVGYIGLAKTTNLTETFSFFVKYSNSPWVFIEGFDGTDKGAFFNIQTGNIGSTSGGATANIEEAANGFYRCSITATFTGATTFALFQVISNGSFTRANGDVIIWGAQLEVGSYPTSYIRSNTGSATTRLADVANNAGSSDLINSTEGVLYAEISALANDSYRFISLSDGTNNNNVRLNLSPIANQISFEANSGGSLQLGYTNNNTNILLNTKICINFKLNDFSVWINGIKVHTDTNGIAPIGLNTLNFDRGTGTNLFYGNTKSVAVFKEALTDLELECLVSWMSFSDLGINFGYTVE